MHEGNFLLDEAFRWLLGLLEVVVSEQSAEVKEAIVHSAFICSILPVELCQTCDLAKQI